MGKPIKAQDVNLVFVAGREIFCDSLMVSEKFEVKHNRVINIVKHFMSDLERIKGQRCFPLNLKKPPATTRCAWPYLLDTKSERPFVFPLR